MRVKVVPSAWLEQDGRRLDCGPYMSGALEAKVLLQALSARKDPLSTVTRGGMSGIFHAGRIRRTWVESPAHGRPFLSSTDILQCDLSSLPYISNRAVAENPRLPIATGWTLITRSGTIGRMAYSRPDIDGYACSEHVLRVVPEPSRIPPGYLYAYLSSKFGVPLVVGGTYGAIIQHIEPEHIADLPVPRLGEAVERKVHEWVNEAATLRAEASAEISGIERETLDLLGLPDLPRASVSRFSINEVTASNLNFRLDAPYHSKIAAEAVSAVASCKHPTLPLSKAVERYFKPPMFKRLWVDSSEYGCQFVSGIEAYRYQAEDIRYVSFRTPHFDEFILREGSVIFQAAGQIYGLFGRPLFVSGWLTGLFAADDLYRLVPRTIEDGGYIFAFLRTAVGQILIKRQASGNSIPRVWDPHMRDISIPWPGREIRHEIGRRIITAHEKIERARISEANSIALVESTIEEGSP